MSRLRLGVKTVYFPFLFVCAILIGTLVLSGMQNVVTKNECVTAEDGRGHLVVVPEKTTEDQVDDSLEFTRVIEDRKQHANDICDEDDNVTFYRDVREHLLFNTDSNMVFCYVPKVASTMWKTVFHLIDKPGLSQVELGEEIVHMRKGYIHTVRLPWMANIRPFSHVFAFLNSATRIMFTRDPYARLFSAFVDKLMLPSFWKPVGIAIVNSQRHDQPRRSTECGHDVTFEEFLRHVADVNSDPALIKYGIDDHWIPVSWICQPCQMDYDFIGKIETFSADRDVVLEKVMGLSDTVQYLRSNLLGAENSMNQAINTSWFAVVNFRRCVTKVDIMKRLWFSFKVQGYLPASLPLPGYIVNHSGTSYESKEVFRDFVLQMYEKHRLDHEQSSKQRRAHMSHAYQTVDPKVKQAILKTFMSDFEIFNYEKYPLDLYRDDRKSVFIQ